MRQMSRDALPVSATEQIVHYDNRILFCEAAAQGGVLTTDEAEVTCPDCLRRLRAIDRMVPRAQVGLHRIDWFGEEEDGP